MEKAYTGKNLLLLGPLKSEVNAFQSECSPLEVYPVTVHLLIVDVISSEQLRG